MGKKSREKRERREKGILSKPKEEEKVQGAELWLKKIIFYGVCLTAFTPLIMSSRFFFPFVGPKSLYFMGLAEIIFFAWLFLIIFWPRYRPRFNLVLGVLIIYLFVLVLSTIFGVDPFYSFWSKFERMTGLLMMIHLFLFFLVVSSSFNKKDWIKLFLLSSFIGVVLVVVTYTSGDPFIRGKSTLGNDSFFGTVLLFYFFFALYLFFKSANYLKIYSLLACVIIGLGLLFSGARAAKLSLLGGLFLFFILYLVFNQKKKWIRVAGAVILGLVLLGAVLFSVLALEPESFVRKQIIERAVGESFGGRFVVWRGAWESFLERPFLGWGPETFEYAFLKHYNPCYGTPRCGNDIWYDRAHNIIFDTLVSTGILGMVSYLLIFGAVFWFLWRAYFKKKIDFWTSGIFSVLLIAYFVQNLTVFDMISSYMIFFLILGFVGSLAAENNDFDNRTQDENQGQRQDKKPNQALKQFIASLLFVFLIFSLFYFIIKPLKTDFYVIEAFKSKDPQRKLYFEKKALSSSYVGLYQIREQFIDGFANGLKAGKFKDVRVEDLKAHIDFLSREGEKTIKRVPFYFKAYLKLGQLYNAAVLFDASKLDQAENVLEKAIEVCPKNQQGYWELTQTKIFKRDFKNALSLAESALDLEPQMKTSWLIVLKIAKIIGDENLIKEKKEEALKVHPDLEGQVQKILSSS